MSGFDGAAALQEPLEGKGAKGAAEEQFEASPNRNLTPQIDLCAQR